MSTPSTTDCAMAVMAKASIPGRAKTRLVPPLTAAEAALFNTAFLQDIAQNLVDAGELAPIRPFMAFAPAGTEQFFRDNLPPGIGLVETVASNFGDCLLHAITALLAAGHGAACLLNSDSPTLPRSYLIAAATVLGAEGDRIVIGPSTDGGYYLIGMKHPHRSLFEGIEWSTERVFEQTVDRARELGVPVVTLPTWYDIDDAETLRLLADELLGDRPFRYVGSHATAALASRQLLLDLIGSANLATRLELRRPLVNTQEAMVTGVT